QFAGEGLFRSEAIAELVVALAESGAAVEAAQILADTPPDRVAYVPGLLPWAQSAVAAASGPSPAAGELALLAAEAAAAQGATPITVRYLADAARCGGRRMACAARDLLPPEATSKLSSARAAGVRAWATGRSGDLVEAAQLHLNVGLVRRAGELADRAVEDANARSSALRIRRAVTVALGDSSSQPTALLTPREREIATMAARGATDKEIAATLVISVRTVETHLRSTYRKLDINSRRALTARLDPARVGGAAAR
ncbi:MAG: helix-turn-helix transcriptional regulator, partial [Nocardioides sp.]